jgi:hypothetical protein
MPALDVESSASVDVDAPDESMPGESMPLLISVARCPAISVRDTDADLRLH